MDNTDRRLTPTERLHEVTMASLGRRPLEPESCVEITRNTKGYNFTVTVRGPDPKECRDVAKVIVTDLEAKYPATAEGGVT